MLNMIRLWHTVRDVALPFDEIMEQKTGCCERVSKVQLPLMSRTMLNYCRGAMHLLHIFGMAQMSGRQNSVQERKGLDYNKPN